MVTEIGELRLRKYGTSKLEINQQRALKNLEENQGIVIKPFDKGGNVVLMNKDDYEKMCLKILKNRSRFKEISPLTTKTFDELFINLFTRARNMGTISEETFFNHCHLLFLTQDTQIHFNTPRKTNSINHGQYYIKCKQAGGPLSPTTCYKLTLICTRQLTSITNYWRCECTDWIIFGFDWFRIII